MDRVGSGLSLLVLCLSANLLTFVHLAKGLRPPLKDVTPAKNHPLRNWTYRLDKFHKNTLNYTIKDVQLGCKELRSKKYISDGYCTSMKPTTEVVCAGVCLPVADLPWYTELLEQKAYRTAASQWRCTNDHVARERVHLICQDGSERSYKVRLVRSCKCKKHAKKTYFNHLF